MDQLHFNFEGRIENTLVVNNEIFCQVSDKLAIIDIETFKLIEFIEGPIFKKDYHLVLSDDKKTIFAYNIFRLFKFDIETYEIKFLANIEEFRSLNNTNFYGVVRGFNATNDNNIIIFRFGDCRNIIMHNLSPLRQTIQMVIFANSSFYINGNYVYYFEIGPKNIPCGLVKLDLVNNIKLYAKPLDQKYVDKIAKMEMEEIIISYSSEASRIYAKKKKYLFVYDAETLELVHMKTGVSKVWDNYVVIHSKSVLKIYDINDGSLIDQIRFIPKDDSNEYLIFGDILKVWCPDGSEYFVNILTGTYKLQNDDRRIWVWSNNLTLITDDRKYIISKSDHKINRYNITHVGFDDQKKAFMFGEFKVGSVVYKFINNVLFDKNLVDEIFKFMPGY